jgi:HEXXH motif-containing protein
VTATDGIVVLPSLGGVQVDGPTALVKSTDDGAVVYSAGARVGIPPDPHHDAPGWLGLRRVRVGGLDILIDDVDPFRMPTLPDLVSRLTTTEIGQWRTIVERSWPLLGRCPEAAAEVSAAVAAVIPIRSSAYHQVSSSTAESFGAIAMSRPSDPYTCAVTLAHEVQHVKLSALLALVELTMPDDGRRYYAPWRPDPRPISGLLQGAYAYLGVSGFWRRHRQLAAGAEQERAAKEFARWRAAVALVLATLSASGQLTPRGLDFVQGMKETLGAWQEESVQAGAEALARREAELHLARWESDNGPLRD